MAQILKDDVRKAIITAAKQEFLEKGYKGASMRSIAKNANMTVGNLYRYYKNKEDINLSIVSNTFIKIDNAIKALNKKDVSVEIRMFDVKPNLNDLKANYDLFAEELVNIYFANKVEFNILMLHSRVSEEMINKFKDMVKDMLSEAFILKDLSKDSDLFYRTYAQSLFAGLRCIFKDNNDDINALKKIVKVYIRSFLDMLDSDLNKYCK